MIVQTYSNYPKYATSDDEVKQAPFGTYVHSVKEHTAEHEIDNRSVYENLNQICKNTDLYPNINQHMLKRPFIPDG